MSSTHTNDSKDEEQLKMTKLSKQELDERISGIIWEDGDIQPMIKQLLRDYMENIVPEKDNRTHAEPGVDQGIQIGFNALIDTIHNNASELLGDTE